MNSFINKVILFPHYITLRVRHFLYDRKILKSYSFEIPIVVVGNLSMGGTGKTPHTEYLVKELIESERVAVLSRGYGRKSRGFRYVNCDDSVVMSGDEPLQIKRKFPQATVVVDGNRVRAIKRLLELPVDERPTIIIMDDGFQHRRVLPSTSILLIDWSNPPSSDRLFPLGRLRDLPSQIARADIVVVTKSPPEISESDLFLWERRLKLKSSQTLLFSTLIYSDAVALFKEGDRRYLYSNFAQLLTAIATPKALLYKLMESYKIVDQKKYRDHKNFTNRTANTINKMVEKRKKAVLFTTEKDSQRILSLKNLTVESKKRLFFLPISVSFHNLNGGATSIFNKKSLPI